MDARTQPKRVARAFFPISTNGTFSTSAWIPHGALITKVYTVLKTATGGGTTGTAVLGVVQMSSGTVTMTTTLVASQNISDIVGTDVQDQTLNGSVDGIKLDSTEGGGLGITIASTNYTAGEFWVYVEYSVFNDLIELE